MRKYGKWLLVLGILAANPAWVSADGVLSGLRQTLPGSRTALQERNQAKAQEVAGALKQARINGYDLSVEVNGNAVKLEGKVRDVTHRALAEQACKRVEGIQQVVNNLRYAGGGQVQQTSAQMSDSSLRPAVYQQNETEDGIRQVHFQKPGKRTPSKTTSSRSGGGLSRFLPSLNRNRNTTAQRSYQRPTQQRTAPQQRSTQQPKQQPSKTAGKSIEVSGAPLPSFAPSAVPPAKAEATTPKAAAPKAVEPKIEKVSAPAAPAVAPNVTAAKSLDLTPPPKTAFAPAPKPVATPLLSNQDVAQSIAMNLANVGLVGYDVEIRYENGIATLNGDVGTTQQMQAATFAASQIDAVRDVKNNLQVKGPIAQTSFGGPQPPAVRPAAMTMPPAMMMASMQQQGAAMPTAIAGAGNYSNPNLPKHAWPAMAAYPNSAAISYPKQYSASAWPYIGPFYPYPQVPLGWREVSLQWDDGHWQIDFEKKHKAWYWLWQPKNWY